MRPENVHKSEMRRKRLVGNQQAEDLLPGQTGGDPSDAGLAAFITEVRSTYLGGGIPEMSAGLLDAVDALVSAQPMHTGLVPVGPTRRRLARMTTFLAAKLAALTLGAKVALAATVAVASVGGLGLSESLPDPIQNTFDSFVLQDDGFDDAGGGGNDDYSFSWDFSVDEDGETDESADGTNTTEGAPPVIVDLLAAHCAGLAGDPAAEYDWSWDTSTSPDGETDTAYDFSCEFVDAAGCEITVDFSYDTSQTPGEEADTDDEGVNIDNSCLDDEDGDDDGDGDDDDNGTNDDD